MMTSKSTFNNTLAAAISCGIMFVLVAIMLLTVLMRSNSLYINPTIFDAAVKACESFSGLRHVLPNTRKAVCNNEFEVDIAVVFYAEDRKRQAEANAEWVRVREQNRQMWMNTFKERCADLKSEVGEVSFKSDAFAKCKNGYFVHDWLTPEQKEVNKVLTQGLYKSN
jgi:hypothetical protein